MTLERERKPLHWPITIARTRYGGAYEGGDWAAFHLYPEQIPKAAFGDDITCATWWEAMGAGVGLGETPDEAFESLKSIPDPLSASWDSLQGRWDLKRQEWRLV